MFYIRICPCFGSESRFSCKLSPFLTLAQPGEVRGCCYVYGLTLLLHGENTQRLSLWLSRCTPVQQPQTSCIFFHFCIHLHFKIYIFLALNTHLMGLVSITISFSFHIPYLASPDVWAGREAGKSRSVCAASGTSLVSSNELSARGGRSPVGVFWPK